MVLRREHKSRADPSSMSTLLAVRMNERVWKESEARFGILVVLR